MAEGRAIPSGEPALVAATAPSAGRAVWLVAVRELMEQITSLRFLVISLLVVGLTPLAVFVGVRDYQNRRAEHDRMAAERQALAAGPSGERVTGTDAPFTPHNDLAVLRALRPPETLSVLVRGLDGALPQYWDFSPTGFEAGPSATRSERLVDLLGQLDIEFLVRVVLGLLAILLAFDAVAGEKELGTLRAALSQPLSRPAFLAGKLIGGAFTLWIAVLATFLIGLLSAQLFGVLLLDRDSLTKVVLIAATSCAYLLCMYALGLLISCLTSSQKTSLVVLLVVWVLVGLALPPMAALVAQAVSPVTPANAVAIKKRVLDDALYKDAAKSMGLAYREIVGGPGEGGLPAGSYEAHKQEIDRRITPILLGYLNKRRQLVGELDRDVERRAVRQKDAARALMALSPSAAFVRAAADLAATGDDQHGAWLEAVRRQQRNLERVLFEDPPLVMFHLTEIAMSAGLREPPAGEVEARAEKKGPRVSEFAMLVERRQPPAVTSLPAFVPPRRDAAAALVRALPALGLLVLYTGVFIIGSFIAFARYDIR